MAYNEDEAAAAAVSAVFLLAGLCSIPNLKVTGFKLYIPLGIASIMRGVAFAAAARFAVTRNPDFLAVRGALVAVGLGISIAMCACFLVIWLRNAAAASRPPPAATRVLSVLARAMVACVITFGPILGVTAVGLLYGGAGNPKYMKQGMDVRSASTAGFLAASALLVLLTAAATVCWLAAALRAKAAARQQRQQHAAQQHAAKQPQAPGPGPAAGDGRICLLLAATLLLLWSTITKELATSSVPALATSRQLLYPLTVLPELAVACLWAWPRLASQVALASRYDAWRQQQQQQGKQQGKQQGQQQQQDESEGSAESVDGQAAVAEGAGVKWADNAV